MRAVRELGSSRHFLDDEKPLAFGWSAARLLRNEQDDAALVVAWIGPQALIALPLRRA